MSDLRVAIVGKGPSRMWAPWNDSDWEMWGLNDPDTESGWRPVEEHARWFQLHPPEYMRVHYPSGLEALREEWGRRRGVTLYMDRHYPEYPDSVPYPRDAVERLTQRGGYHASSIDWMVALAVHERAREIALFGVNCRTFPTRLDGEPISARACLEYWLGVAEGRGIRVQIAGGGDLLRMVHVARLVHDVPYGFEREPALDLAVTGVHPEDEWQDVR